MPFWVTNKSHWTDSGQTGAQGLSLPYDETERVQTFFAMLKYDWRSAGSPAHNLTVMRFLE